VSATLDTLTTDLRFADGLRFNIAAESRKFDCKFIEPGIVSYKDQGGGIELLRKETLDRCMASAIGNPLILGHTYIHAENRLELEEGIVHSFAYNSDDGWYYVSGEVSTPSAQNRMRRGERPSCGYRVKELGPGGTYHGIKYDAEILDIEFNHLAIVDNPRYELAEFRLNSVNVNVSNPTNIMFKFLKKLVTRENGADGKVTESTKVESHEVSGDTEIEVEGKMVKLNSLADCYMAETKAAVIRTASGDDEVEVEGKNVKLNELVDCYKKNMGRSNAAPVVPVVVAPVVAAAPAESDEQKAIRENGAKAFAQLQNAAVGQTTSEFASSSDSLSERCARGTKRY
jgi:hypothetical protein